MSTYTIIKPSKDTNQKRIKRTSKINETTVNKPNQSMYKEQTKPANEKNQRNKPAK